MSYTLFIFDGNFANYANPEMGQIRYDNVSADDARNIIETSLKYGMDIVIRQVE